MAAVFLLWRQAAGVISQVGFEILWLGNCERRKKLDESEAYAWELAAKQVRVIRAAVKQDRRQWIEERSKCVAMDMKSGRPQSLWKLVRDLIGRASRKSAPLELPVFQDGSGGVDNPRRLAQFWNRKFLEDYDNLGEVRTLEVHAGLTEVQRITALQRWHSVEQEARDSELDCDRNRWIGGWIRSRRR